MAEETEGSSRKKILKRSSGKTDFSTVYDKISEGNKNLEANKRFWTTKGNSQKYFCVLCNIGVKVSSNLNTFKSAVIAHVEDKYHRKKYETFVAKENVVNVPVADKNHKEMGLKKIEEEISILSIIEQEEEDLTRNNMTSNKDLTDINDNSGDQGVLGEEKKKKEDEKKNGCLVDFDSIYNSFEKSDPVVKTSKQFLVKTENGRDFFCNLCKVLVLNPLSATEFRYNLFVHINEESHREKLPNFQQIEEDFNKEMMTFSKKLPAFYKNEMKCFKVGPVFRFVKCTLCDLAVSCNPYRLENHLKNKDHIEKRYLEMRRESLQLEPLHDRTRDSFRKLVVQLDDKFKKDVKYINIGKIPGYVICSLCSYVVMPTKFYVETHLSSPVHEKNKKSNLINRNSKFKTNLKDLLNTLPKDLQGYDFFLETASGLTCKRCDITIPPTSYDLYTHINVERLGNVSK